MDSSELYFVLFWIGLLIFGILYASRKATASLERVEEKKPGLPAEIAYYAAKWTMILSLLGFLIPWLLMSWPPRWMERREQRKEVFKRVESAGGWAKIVEGTRILLATNISPVFRISPRYETNFALPSAVAALKAQDIELQRLQGLSTAFVQIYGMHSSGGRGQAFYWLYIVDEGSPAVALERLRSRFNRPRTIHQITNGVFEIY